MLRVIAGWLWLLCAAAAVSAGPVTFLDETFAYDTARPAAGFWLGNVTLGPRGDTWAALTLDAREGQGANARITVIGAMAVDAPCTDLVVDAGAVSFNVGAIPGKPRFQGKITPDGQRLAGSLEYADGRAAGAFELARTPRPTDLPDPLIYRGALASQGGKLDIGFAFAKTPGGNWVGHVDVPLQGLRAFPLVNVHREGDRITAEIAVSPAPALIDATLADGEKRLSGRFHQGPFDLELDLARSEGGAPPAARRPQEPVPPYPYQEREVEITHPDGYVLAGTLTIPSGAGPFPAALLITGSGPEDRNESVFGHKPFLIIADYLSRHGIAVLRCDDRGVGASTGDATHATSADLAGDARVEMDFLRNDPAVDKARVGLIGHSEGGLIAPMVAAQGPGVAYIVLLAGPGVPGDELLSVQLRKILEAGGADAVTIATTCAQQQEILKLLRSDKGEAELREAMRPIVEAQMKASMGLQGDDLSRAIESSLAQAASPWMRYFVSYDPRPALSKVHCPVLALNGTLDMQVSAEQNLPEIEKALRAAGTDVTARRYTGLNHLFQPATTGAIAEYASIETTFDEAVLRDIVAWINLKTGAGDAP